MAQWPLLNTPLDVCVLMVTAYQKVLFVKTVFYKKFINNAIYICLFRLVLGCLLVAKKENLTGYFNRFDRLVEKSRPDR